MSVEPVRPFQPRRLRPAAPPPARRPLWPLLAAAAAIATLSTAATAESLRDALISAYQANPGLDAERARLRALDEDVPAAKSGYRPTISGEATAGVREDHSDPGATADGETRPLSLGISVRQPLFDGFRTQSAVNAAEAEVRAGRARLDSRETATLLEAVTAYMDVVRDTAIVGLRQRNVGVLSEELRAAEARRAAREVTLTDVAQARSRRARAVSAADLAQANLKISRANYKRVVGHAPEALHEPPLAVRGLPTSIEEARRIAGRESPNLIAALYSEQSARHAVDRAWSGLLPQIDLEAGYSHQNDVSAITDERSSASITGRLRIPLYQGGQVHAEVRKAKHSHVGRIQDIEAVRDAVESDVTAAWSRLQAARAQLASDEVQVDAARTALRGVREEEKVGQRTLLDVLNAEQEFLDAQVSLISTRRDLVVASYTVLASIGRLSAQSIELSTEIYHPEAHYEEVRRKWAGVTITRTENYDAPTEFAVTSENLPPVAPFPSPRAAFAAADVALPEPTPEPLLERLFRRTFAADGAASSFPGVPSPDAPPRTAARGLRGSQAATGSIGPRKRSGAAIAAPAFRSTLD